jgi:hypothetical protein
VFPGANIRKPFVFGFLVPQFAGVDKEKPEEQPQIYRQLPIVDCQLPIERSQKIQSAIKNRQIGNVFGYGLIL